MKSRTKLFIYNIIVAAICIAVIVSFFIAPFWQVKINYTVTPEAVKELVSKTGAGSGGESGSGSSDSLNPDEMISKIELSDEDYEKVVGKDGFKLSVSIRLDTAALFASLAGGQEKEEEAVRNLIDSNVSYVVGELVPKINTLVGNALPVVTKVVINQAIADQLDKAIADTGSDEIRQAMEEAGLTNEYIEEKSDALVEAIYAENATVDSIADTVVDTVEEVFIMMKESPNQTLSEIDLSPEGKEQIRSQVKEAISVLADENGKIDADELVADLILRALGQTGGESQGGGQPEEGGSPEEGGLPEEGGGAFEESGARKAAVPLADSDGELTSTEELKIKLTELVMEKIDDNTVKMLSIVMMVISGLILFTMFTWAYLILKILVKLFCKNPGIKLALPIWLGWLPFLLLVLMPTIVFSVLKGNPGLIGSIAGAEAAATISGQLSAIGIGFSSCTIVAFIGAILLFVLFFFYRRPRKRLKRLKRLRKINPNATEADL